MMTALDEHIPLIRVGLGDDNFALLTALVRSVVLQVPTRIKSRCPQLSDDDVALLDGELRHLLEQLKRFPVALTQHSLPWSRRIWPECARSRPSASIDYLVGAQQ